MEWWRARPSWQKVLIVVGVLIVIGGIASGGEDQSTEEQVAAATTTEAAVTTSSEAPTTTTTLPPTTTVATTTTTLSAETMRILLASVLDSQRVELIDAFEEVFIVERVDSLEYDGADFIEMGVTTFFPSLQSDPSERSDDAWSIIQGWGIFFESFLEGSEFPPDAMPGVSLIMNGRWKIDCSGEFMALMADRRADQADFNSECSGLG